MRFIAVLVSGFVFVGGCGSSSDKPAASGTGGAPPDAGQKEAGVKYTCEQPMDLLSSVDHAPTGFVLCANSAGGLMHRTEIKACGSLLPRTATCQGVGSGTDSGTALGYCKTDADCTTKGEGFCTVTQRNATCSCYYGCKADADCGPGNVCVCGNPTGECHIAQCTSDADCGAGKLCLSAPDGHCRTIFVCQTVKDLCAGDRDCTNSSYSQCTFTGDHRECQQPKNCGI